LIYLCFSNPIEKIFGMNDEIKIKRKKDEN